MYRFARAARIYDGPDEVHRQCVARQILRGYEAPEDGVPTEHVPTRREARARAVRRPARGGDLQRLGAGLVIAMVGAVRPSSWSPLVLALAGGGGEAQPAAALARAKVDRFDARRARWRHLHAPGEARAAPGRLAALARARGATCASGCRAGTSSTSGRRPAQRRRAHPGAQAGGRGRRALRHEGPARASWAPTTAPAARRRCSSSPARCAARSGRRARPRSASCSSTARRPPTTTRPFEETGAARLQGLRASATRRRAGAGPARLRGREGRDAHPARGQLAAGAVAAAARGGASASGAGKAFPDETQRRDHRRPHAVPASAACRRST